MLSQKVLFSMTLKQKKGWQIRTLDIVDADAVTALVHLAFLELDVPLDPPPKALNETIASIARQISAGGGAGAEAAGKLVGSILWASCKGLYVSRLAVHPEWRRRGIAGDLLTCAELEARRQGVHCIHLETRLALTGNLRLFTRLGFKEFARQPSDSDPQRTLVKLEKRIARMA
jgi:tRNA threonylcarbamoyladenosine biosynthesis protein TsaE